MILTYCFCCPADLNQMHKLNEEAYSNPEQWQRRATAAMTARRAELPDPNERVSGTVAECSIHDSIDSLSGSINIFISNSFSCDFAITQFWERARRKRKQTGLR